MVRKTKQIGLKLNKDEYSSFFQKMKELYPYLSTNLSVVEYLIENYKPLLERKRKKLEE